jgi:hypothetical protein
MLEGCAAKLTSRLEIWQHKNYKAYTISQREYSTYRLALFRLVYVVEFGLRTQQAFHYTLEVINIIFPVSIEAFSFCETKTNVFVYLYKYICLRFEIIIVRTRPGLLFTFDNICIFAQSRIVVYSKYNPYILSCQVKGFCVMLWGFGKKYLSYCVEIKTTQSQQVRSKDLDDIINIIIHIVLEFHIRLVFYSKNALP